jgi:hypothetical protein
MPANTDAPPGVPTVASTGWIPVPTGADALSAALCSRVGARGAVRSPLGAVLTAPPAPATAAAAARAASAPAAARPAPTPAESRAALKV